MSKSKVKVVKSASETAKDQLMNFGPRGATAYGEEVTAILKPLKDSELKELADYFNEQFQQWGQSEGYDLSQTDDDGGVYYVTEDAIGNVETMLDCVRCVEQVQSEIDRRVELAAKKPNLRAVK